MDTHSKSHSRRSDSPGLTILLPCFNEAVTLKKCIEEIKVATRELEVSTEILVADNGSQDGSPEIATSNGARVIHVFEKGYGNALRAGIESAESPLIIFADADLSYSFSDIPIIYDRMLTGAEFVIGNRFGGRMESKAMPWKNRYIGNPVLSFIGRLLFPTPVRDFHCGLRGISKRAFKTLGVVSSGMEFASEMVVKASLLNIRTEEFPTVLRRDGRDSSPRLRPWRDGWRHLRLMLALAPEKTLIFPGLALTVLGLVAWLFLLSGPVEIRGMRFDIHTLALSSSSLICGCQIVGLGLLAREYAQTVGLRPATASGSLLQKRGISELMLIIGAGCILTGVAAAGIAIMDWAGASFGDLDPAETMRVVIPAITFTIIGCQFIASSVVISLMNLPVRKSES